jgi:hypothetical protein
MTRQTTLTILCVFSLLAGSASAEVWKDDFENDELGESWTSATFRVNAPPNWKVENGVLRGSWLHPGSGEMLFLEEYPSLDYTIQVKGRIDQVWQASKYADLSIVFRSSGPAGNKVTPFYAFALVSFRTFFFIAHDAANWRDVAVAPGKYNIGEWYTLKLVVRGNRFLGYVDDKLVCELRDRQFKGKFVGVATGYQVDVSFDDFTITDQVDDDAFLDFDVSPEGMALTTTWASLKVQ